MKRQNSSIEEVTASDQLRHIDIKAPVDGVVHELSIHTIGGVITPAETLMLIVPQHDNLTVEARIAPQDIDQLSVGQGARLMLTAFNRNTTPELQGSLVRISADLETDKQTGASFYSASVTISQTELGRLRELVLLPGMPVETFIRTGDRTVLSYFVKTDIGSREPRVPSGLTATEISGLFKRAAPRCGRSKR